MYVSPNEKREANYWSDQMRIINLYLDLRIRVIVLEGRWSLTITRDLTINLEGKKNANPEPLERDSELERWRRDPKILGWKVCASHRSLTLSPSSADI